MAVSKPGPLGLLELVTPRMVAAPRALSACVPMPKITVPVTLTAPACATAGSVMMVPLLSLAKAATGFGNCSKGATADEVRAMMVAHPVVGQS